MTVQTITFKDYLRKCMQLGARCYWRIFALTLMWTLVSQIIGFVSSSLMSFVAESITAYTLLIITTVFLEIALALLVMLTLTNMKLDVINDRPLKLLSLIQRSASPQLLTREAVLSSLWVAPYVIAVSLIFIPSIVPLLLSSVAGNQVISFILSISYLLGLVFIVLTPFFQLRWMFAKFVMIDEHCTPRQAIQKSKKISSYFTYWRIAGVLVLALIPSVLLLAIPLFGLLVCLLMVPFYSVTGVAAYQIYLENNQPRVEPGTDSVAATT